jgi:preprotein translocase subunit SecG
VFGILLTLLILDGILLMVVVLLQAGKGGGLAAMGGGSGAGTESLIGGRQAATVLTKSTWITGAVFIALSVVLSVLSSRAREDAPLLQDQFQPTQSAPQPILPGMDEAPAGEGGQGGVPGVEGETGGGAAGDEGTDGS